jgi:small subunit ribosomal protein S11
MGEQQNTPAPAAPAAGGAPGKKEAKKIRKKAEIAGIVMVNASFNNTIVTISNPNGEVVAWASSGKAGFKGSRKSMPYAASVAAEIAAKAALEAGMKRADVKIRGGGVGRESAVRAMRAAGLEITSIKDITTTPHNGCRREKRRRI